MKKLTLIGLGISASIAVLAAGVAISAQDKYAVQVPNELAFSEFRGYEDWPGIAISENGGAIAVIVGNPAMIAAYRDSVPENGKPFPDQALPRRSPNGENPLDPEKAGGLSRSTDGARRPARR